MQYIREHDGQFPPGLESKEDQNELGQSGVPDEIVKMMADEMANRLLAYFSLCTSLRVIPRLGNFSPCRDLSSQPKETQLHRCLRPKDHKSRSLKLQRLPRSTDQEKCR